MCLIASIFLLQRLKGSTSGDARVFNNKETLDINQVFLLQGNLSHEKISGSTTLRAAPSGSAV